jgi:AraC-like DNA-binding protein
MAVLGNRRDFEANLSKAHVISERQGIGGCGKVVQNCDLPVSRFTVSSPTLVFIARGAKIIRTENAAQTIQAGTAVVLSSGRTFDIVNLVDDAGAFRSEWFSWDEALVHQQAPSLQALAPPSSILLLRPPEQCLTSLRAAADGVGGKETVPWEIAAHRASEVLLWIKTLTGHLPSIAPRQLPHRLRGILQQDLARCWTAAVAACELGMSEPTMRRKLAEFNTTFSNILGDSRMLRALQLLQSTDLSVTRIALEVGYESPSRFAVRFRERFGYSPGALRGYRRDESSLQAAE